METELLYSLMLVRFIGGCMLVISSTTMALVLMDL